MAFTAVKGGKEKDNLDGGAEGNYCFQNKLEVFAAIPWSEDSL